jgi:fibronectin-binding autotransporter adhesin
MKSKRNAVIVTVAAAFLALPAHAQYTGNYQTNIIMSGVVSNWTGDYIVGSSYVFDALLIQNGGRLSCSNAEIGFLPGASNNTAIVNGGVWTNSVSVYVGFNGDGNQLFVTNGGKVFSTTGTLSGRLSASNNVVTVSGNGATWENTFTLFVGEGSGNTLNIGNGGSVVNVGQIRVGFTTSLAIDNRINVTGGSLFATNALGTGALDIRRGALTFGGGNITVDSLVLTNGAPSVFVFNSGLLNTHGTAVNNTQYTILHRG